MRKLKLMGSISAFMLCMAMMVFGVYSALSVNFTLGGSITYDAVNIQATISAASVGAGLTVTDSSNKMQAVTYNGSSATPANVATWSNLDIALTDDTTATITFTITNTHAEKYLKVTVGEPTNTAVNNMTVAVSGVTVGTATYLNNATESEGKSVIITVTFDVTNTLVSASMTGFNIPINLEHATEMPFYMGSPVALSSLTPAQIKEVGQHGSVNAQNQWVIGNNVWFEVGDTVTMTLTDNTPVVLELADFNHDKDANNQTIPFTFVTKYLLPSSYNHVMNPSTEQYQYGTNIGGWPQSSMYSYLNGNTDSIWSKIPTAWQQVIVPAVKSTLVGGGQGKNVTTKDTSTDKLFLLSMVEVGIDVSNFWEENLTSLYGDEGRIYPIFTYGNDSQAKNSRIKSYQGGEADWWWLRSPYYINSINFVVVYSNANYGCNLASDAGGVVFAFCI